MLIIAFVALTILITAILLTRHYYLTKLENLAVALEDENNLNFRQGFDAGWQSGVVEGQKLERIDALMKKHSSM